MGFGVDGEECKKVEYLFCHHRKVSSFLVVKSSGIERSGAVMISKQSSSRLGENLIRTHT